MASTNESFGLVDSSVSETSPHIQLHPLVLVSVDDHGTRSNVRSQGPIIGAIFGQHHGKDISMEASFECGSEKLFLQNSDTALDPEWFSEMVKLYTDTHPSLILVGWYSFGSVPTPWHTKVQLQLQRQFQCETPVFFLYHWDQVTDNSVGKKLPFTLYESFIHLENQEHGGMEIDDNHGSHALKFRPLTYSIESSTDEAIGLADIVNSATTATLKQQASKPSALSEDRSKGKAAEQKDVTAHYLTPHEEDEINFLTSRANAIKMLQSRLAVIIAYLQKQPRTNYLADSTQTPTPISSIDNQILRSIAALEAHLRLTSPQDSLEISREFESNKTDVDLITLLSKITETVQDARNLTKKAAMIKGSSIPSTSRLDSGGIESLSSMKLMQTAD